MRIIKVLSAFYLAAAIAASASAASTNEKEAVARGKYLVKTAGCNDCHTAGYPESGGKVPESEWLTGSAVGFSGPWGTSYPANLRLTAQAMPEGAWVARARSELRPPMPWFALRDMTDADVRAIYRYIRSLGPKGAMVPVYVPPGGKVTTPYIEFVPKNLPPRAEAK
jgi:mono/diheme cytochrome c family protein